MYRFFLVLGLAVFSIAAPRSRSKGPQLVYDQKQKGDYNIQVHLKDFQIIALLGEDSLGGFGDYDYNYDYADFTVKPSSSSTSNKPTEEASTTLKSTEAVQITTKVYEKPSTTQEPEKDLSEKPLSTGKPLGLLGEMKPEEEKLSLGISTTLREDLSSSTEKQANIENANKIEEPKPMAADAIPGQIQVQILESPEGYPNFAVRKDTPHENVGHDSSGKSNEKKCLSGFVKDKKGRCRRLRRPQSALPFDFGRLAHLAARFRSADKDGSSHPNIKTSPVP